MFSLNELPMTYNLNEHMEERIFVGQHLENIISSFFSSHQVPDQTEERLPRVGVNGPRRPRRPLGDALGAPGQGRARRLAAVVDPHHELVVDEAGLHVQGGHVALEVNKGGIANSCALTQICIFYPYIQICESM